MLSNETLLRIWTESNGKKRHYLPPESARGCKQTLNLLNISDKKRTIGGALVEQLSASSKYYTVIKGRDVFPAALEASWRTLNVWVDCITTLTLPISQEDSPIKLRHKSVPGSVYLETSQEKRALETEEDRQTVKKFSLREAQGFLSYRPRLLMFVKHLSISADEWANKHEWIFELEEI